jgi:hypothetical protein
MKLLNLYNNNNIIGRFYKHVLYFVSFKPQPDSKGFWLSAGSIKSFLRKLFFLTSNFLIVNCIR